MEKPSLKTMSRLLKLRGTLDQIGQVSFSFSVLNREYPIKALSEEKAQELIFNYENFIKQAKNILLEELEKVKAEKLDLEKRFEVIKENAQTSNWVNNLKRRFEGSIKLGK